MAYIVPVFYTVPTLEQHIYNVDLAERQALTYNRDANVKRREQARLVAEQAHSAPKLWGALPLRIDDSVPNVIQPADKTIIRYPAKVAYGATKPKSSNMGGGAKPTSEVYRAADRRNLLNRAARR